MVTALDVAGYVYKRSGWVSAWKLEKLTYFAQSWHLAWDGRPLFEDKFQAWSDGPVQPDLYRVNKYDRKGLFGTNLPGANPSALDPATQAIVDAVLDFYRDMDQKTLIELSHEQPWLRARGDLAPKDYCDRELSESDMRRWYTAKVLDGDPNIPVRPNVGAATVSDVRYQDAVDQQIARWAETLDLLAER